MDISSNERLGNYILQLAKGDTSTLTEIYQLTAKTLYRIANSWAFKCADVEDSVYEFIEYLCKIAKKFNKNENALAWLCKSFINLLKNKHKRENIEKDYLEKECDKLMSAQKYQAAEYIINHVLLNEIIAILDKYEQNLYFYRFTCDLSLNEIATELGKPKSTVQYQIDCLEAKIKKFIKENDKFFVR